MDQQQIKYRNTDLDLVVDVDPAALVAELEEKGLCVFAHEPSDDGLWYVICEDGGLDYDLVINITHLLNAVEALSDKSREVWNRCSEREFNAGYDCGFQPRCLEQSLPHEVLKRIVACESSFGITLYRPFDETQDRVSRVDLTENDEEE